MKTALIITSINNVNSNIKKISLNSKQHNWDFIVIGDKKTPKKYKLTNGSYFNIKMQKKMGFSFSKICPENSYSRKNIGYLIAAKRKNEVFIETDDDNFPKKNFFRTRQLKHYTNQIKNNSWINIYDIFLKKNKNIWPRGLPMSHAFLSKIRLSKKKHNFFYLQQGVCENNPDVDAIYRLMYNRINIKFKSNIKVSLGKSLSPFNSQNTTWFKEILPLMYLPVTCNMRTTDILRGYVALNILRKNNSPILFYGTDMFQNRNIHSLINDFEQEIYLYKFGHKILKILSTLKLKKGKLFLIQNMYLSYKSLIKNGLLNKKELIYLNAWVNDIKNLSI